MKKIMILVFVVSNARSQGLSNLFSQQAADIKYVLAQIALMQVYIGYVEKGYKIAQDGLNIIGEIKQGDLNMHSLYFNSLLVVNPSIAGYSKVQAIRSMYQSIVSAFNYLEVADVDGVYFKAVYHHLLDECDKDLNDLNSMTSDGVYGMSDDERIQRIDLIYQDMTDKLGFAQHFTGEVKELRIQREMETKDIQALKKLE